MLSLFPFAATWCASGCLLTSTHTRTHTNIRSALPALTLGQVRILGILGGGWRIRACWYVDGHALIGTEFTEVIFCLLC